jgi:hypothetical protein
MSSDSLLTTGIASLVVIATLLALIRNAEAYTGAVRIVAFACRTLFVALLAGGFLAFCIAVSIYGGMRLWNDVRVAVQGIETYADVVSTERHEAMRGRRLRRRYTHAYTTTLRPAPQCGIETTVVELDEAPVTGDRVRFYCVPDAGIAALSAEIDWSFALLALVFPVALWLTGDFLLFALQESWRPVFDKPKKARG